MQGRLSSFSSTAVLESCSVSGAGASPAAIRAFNTAGGSQQQADSSLDWDNVDKEAAPHRRLLKNQGSKVRLLL